MYGLWKLNLCRLIVSKQILSIIIVKTDEMVTTLPSFCIIFYMIMISVKQTSESLKFNEQVQVGIESIIDSWPAAQCLQTGNRNGLPPFIGANGKYRIVQHHQAIIYTYRFTCCGVITEWGADVSPGERKRNYTIDFQVWRPTPTVIDSINAGGYSLVGNNRFTSISVSRGLASATPPSQHYIHFQPGDVLGFYMESDEHDDPGIVLKNDRRYGDSELVWHASMHPDEAALLRKGCPYTWLLDGGGNRELPISFTRAAPIISIDTSTNKLL